LYLLAKYWKQESGLLQNVRVLNVSTARWNTHAATISASSRSAMNRERKDDGC
jgi:hypothetical protein